MASELYHPPTTPGLPRRGDGGSHLKSGSYSEPDRWLLRRDAKSLSLESGRRQPGHGTCRVGNLQLSRVHRQRSGTLPDPQTILRLVGSADVYRRFVEYGRMTPRSDLQCLWIDDEIS